MSIRGREPFSHWVHTICSVPIYLPFSRYVSPKKRTPHRRTHGKCAYVDHISLCGNRPFLDVLSIRFCNLFLFWRKGLPDQKCLTKLKHNFLNCTYWYQHLVYSQLGCNVRKEEDSKLSVSEIVIFTTASININTSFVCVLIDSLVEEPAQMSDMPQFNSRRS